MHKDGISCCKSFVFMCGIDNADEAVAAIAKTRTECLHTLETFKSKGGAVQMAHPIEQNMGRNQVSPMTNK